MPVVKKMLPGRTYIVFESEPSPELLKELQARVYELILEELAKDAAAAKHTAIDNDAQPTQTPPAEDNSR